MKLTKLTTTLAGLSKENRELVISLAREVAGDRKKPGPKKKAVIVAVVATKGKKKGGRPKGSKNKNKEVVATGEFKVA